MNKTLTKYGGQGCRGEVGSLCEGVEGEILSQQGGGSGDWKYMVIFKNTLEIQTDSYYEKSLSKMIKENG